MKKREKGITLIALIITVIVLLILAGVSVAAITSSGIFNKAKSAVNEYEKAGKNEQNQLDEYLAMMNNYNTGSTTEPEIDEGVKEWYEVNTNLGNGVTVPGGFGVSNKGGEDNPSLGLVIKDKAGNEFVWVPVPNISEMVWETEKRGKLYDFEAGRGSTVREDSKITTTEWREPSHLTSTNTSWVDPAKETQLETALPTQFNEMTASVNKYGGFYIGRYQTGDLSQAKVVVKRGNADIADQTWYTMYEKGEVMYSGGSVKSSMIWGCQWYATLRWMNKNAENGNYVTNSTGKGNYANETFDYIDINGDKQTKLADTRLRIPTGSAEHTKVNNIYDMGGNVWEWTKEAYLSTDRGARGGAYHTAASSYPASYRDSNGPVNSGSDVGFRTQLYLEP